MAYDNNVPLVTNTIAADLIAINANWELVAQMKTGTYSGDGTTGQAITGLGFSPDFVRIWPRPGAEGNIGVYEKLDQSWSDYSVLHGIAAGSEHEILDSRINSLDADGFTVDDDGSDANPNKNGTTYDYVAWGRT